MFTYPVSTKITIWFFILFIHMHVLKQPLRDPSLGRKKPSFFPKVGFVITLILPFTTWGIFWVITYSRRFWGKRVQISPRRDDKDCKIQRKKGFMWAKGYLYIWKGLHIFPGDSTFILSKISEGILDSRRSYTQGNPNTEILQSVETPKSLFRYRTAKNRATTSQTKWSLFQ